MSDNVWRNTPRLYCDCRKQSDGRWRATTPDGRVAYGATPYDAMQEIGKLRPPKEKLRPPKEHG